jgi:hypothetical protein
MSNTNRGLYGQTESNAAADNAKAERIADSAADTMPGSEGDYVLQMANFRRSRAEYAKAETRMARKGAMLGGMIARVGQRAALQGVANVAQDMLAAGFSPEVVFGGGTKKQYHTGAINRSEGLARHLDNVENCTQIAPAVQPELLMSDDVNVSNGKARVRGQCALINNAARNGLLEKYSGGKPRLTRKELTVKPAAERDCGKDDGDGDTSKRYIV